MVLFCASIRRDSVSLLRFHFLSNVQVFSCSISPVCRLISPYICFSSHFCFLVLFIFLSGLILPIPLFVFLCSFQCNLQVLVLMYQRHPQYVEFSVFFFSRDIESMSSPGWRALCIVVNFLVLWSVIWVPLLFISIIVLSILQGGRPWCLFLWWNFYCRALFREVFSLLVISLKLFLSDDCYIKTAWNQRLQISIYAN